MLSKNSVFAGRGTPYRVSGDTGVEHPAANKQIPSTTNARLILPASNRVSGENGELRFGLVFMVMVGRILSRDFHCAK